MTKRYVVYEVWTRHRIIDVQEGSSPYDVGQPEPVQGMNLSNWHVVDVDPAPRRSNYPHEKYCAHTGPWGCEREAGHTGKHMAWKDYENNVLYPGGEWEDSDGDYNTE